MFSKLKLGCLDDNNFLQILFCGFCSGIDCFADLCVAVVRLHCGRELWAHEDVRVDFSLLF